MAMVTQAAGFESASSASLDKSCGPGPGSLTAKASARSAPAYQEVTAQSEGSGTGLTSVRFRDAGEIEGIMRGYRDPVRASTPTRQRRAGSSR
jgi:hypothetical protein